MRYCFIILLSFFLLSCNKTGEKTIKGKDYHFIEVSVSDKPYQEIDKHLRMTRLIRLEKEPLVAEVKDISIINGHIILSDNTQRLFCYDMKGKLQYQIDKQGNGPGEYSTISYFSIDEKDKSLWIYDGMRAAFMRYHLYTGKFLNEKRMQKPNPSDMACKDGVVYYDNRYHRNYPKDKKLHYSLLVSKNGSDMEETYFPHNEAENEYEFSPSRKCFYHSDSLLFYCKNFDNNVYSLEAKGINTRYLINIPNWLGHYQIERKMEIRELLKSDYSYGLCDIFECNGTLAFRFFKKGFVMNALYDLKKDKQLYCAPFVQAIPDSEVPLISAIVGVYQSQYISILSPQYLDYQLKNNPKVIEKYLPGYNADEDNPVIAFYEVNTPLQ